MREKIATTPGDNAEARTVGQLVSDKLNRSTTQQIEGSCVQIEKQFRFH